MDGNNVPVVQISNLDFRFDSHLPYVLRDVSMTVERGRCDPYSGAAAALAGADSRARAHARAGIRPCAGACLLRWAGERAHAYMCLRVHVLMYSSPDSRTLLIGANGAGKSSMLRILAGRHFHNPSKCQILGRPAFHDTSLGRAVALLGERWGYEAMGDVTVKKLVGGIEDPDWERIDKLMDVLEVEWDWCIYRLSDGQRRRVQLLLGLAKKKELLLLDEVTTDLDVVARQNLLNFLKEESEEVSRVLPACVCASPSAWTRAFVAHRFLCGCMRLCASGRLSPGPLRARTVMHYTNITLTSMRAHAATRNATSCNDRMCTRYARTRAHAHAHARTHAHTHTHTHTHIRAARGNADLRDAHI